MAAKKQSAIEAAIETAGGATSLAKALKISPQAVSKWAKKRQAPAERCIDIEVATGVTRYQLRPDVFGQPPRGVAA